MKIPLRIAKNLLLLIEGETLADSTTKHSVIDSLVEENILVRKGRIKKTLQLHNREAMTIYLNNHFGINNLTAYVEALENEEISRAELAIVSSDSKLKTVRTFKGFLVNSFQPLNCRLNNEPYLLNPAEGTFTFIYDFEQFVPSTEITIVGIENPENFRQIKLQKHLFGLIHPLFV